MCAQRDFLPFQSRNRLKPIQPIFTDMNKIADLAIVQSINGLNSSAILFCKKNKVSNPSKTLNKSKNANRTLKVRNVVLFVAISIMYHKVLFTSM